MRADAPPPQALVSQSTTAAITLGGKVLASDIPVVAGRVAIQVDQDVPQTVDLTLPHEWEQYVLDPTRPGAVLGADGHEIEIVTTLATESRTWWLPMSRYLVSSWDVDGAGVRVQATGLLARVQEYQAATARTLDQRSPIVSEIMRILRDVGLEPVIDRRLPSTTRAPAGFEIGEDQLAALQGLAAAMPCTVRQWWDGAIHLTPALDESRLAPVLSWDDSAEGTIVTPAVSGSRADLYSHFVVPWSREVTYWDPEGEETTETFSGVVEQLVATGRLDYRTFGRRTRRIESDAIATHAQAQAVGINEAARAHLRARTLEVTMAADYRAELDDPVALTVAGETVVGRVTGVEYPLTPDDGDMALTVGVPA